MSTDNTPMRHPYGSEKRYHLQHVHLFAQDLEQSIRFYQQWFDAEVMWDGDYGGARNVFMKIGIGALHFYEQPPRELRRNAVHHLHLYAVFRFPRLGQCVEEAYARAREHVRNGLLARGIL